MVRKATTIAWTLIKRVNTILETILVWLGKQNIFLINNIGVSFWDYHSYSQIQYI